MVLRDLLKGLINSPQTSFAGIAAAVLVVGVSLYRKEPVDWELVFMALGLVGIGVAARDNSTTSEQAGAK